MCEKSKKPFLVLLAGVALLANLVTLIQFIISGVAVNFWSFQWVIGILFIVVLLGVGFGFLILGHEEGKAKQFVMPIFGGIYTIILMILYSFLGYLQIKAKVSVSDFAGFFVLFLVVLAISVSCIEYADESKYFIFPSYGFALCNLLFLIVMIKRYVFDGLDFEFEVFFGDLIILIVGALVFMGFYFISGGNNRNA